MTAIVQKESPTIRNSKNLSLIQRVKEHLGEESLDLTKDLVAGYVDGGLYGGPADPRSRAAFKTTGEEMAKGGSGPSF